MKTVVCVGCGGVLEEASTTRACRLCGAELELFDGEEPDREDDVISFGIAFSTFQCDNDECSTLFLLTEARECPACGQPDDALDEAAEARLKAYGDPLRDLLEETKGWREEPIKFADRGSRQDIVSHCEWMRERAFDKPSDLVETAKVLLRQTDWDSPQAPETWKAFNELLDVSREFGSLVEELSAQPPPLGLLAVHRQATRAVASAGDAVVGFASLLGSAYYLDARFGQEDSQTSLDRAAKRLGDVSLSLRRAESLLTNPGFWTIGSEYDTGRITWEGTDQQVTTIEQGAAIVRQTFETVPGIAGLPDEQALMLMPAVAVGASLQDPERLTQRAIVARRMLDEADEQAGGWIDDIALLVEQVWNGHSQLIDQVVRLGHDIRTEAPREILMHTALDVFAKFYEGPLRNLGGIVALAAQAARDPSVQLDRATLRTYGPSKTTKELSEADELLLDGVLPALRHAEAHYDFHLEEDGVRVRHLGAAGEPERIERFSDDDFFEQVLNLNETLVAIELAVIPWLETRPEPFIQADLEQRSRETKPALQTLRALGGLKGWTDMEFELDRGTLKINGTYRGQKDDDSELSLLTVAAAVWATFDEIERVDLGPALRAPLTVTRERFPSPNASDFESQHLIALLVADTLQATGQITRLEAEVRWKLMPAALVAARAANELMRQPEAELATQILGYLRWARDWLSTETWEQEIQPLAGEVRSTLRGLSRAIGAWRSAPTGSSRLIDRAHRDLLRAVEDLLQLSDRCRGILASL